MTKTEYAAYLASDHWRDLRKGLLAEAPFCEECSLPRWLAEIAYDQDLHVHHLSYAHLGDECPEDLQVLCRRCHEMETFGRSELKAPKSTICEACAAVHWDYRSEFCVTCDQVLREPYIYCLADKAYPFPDLKLQTIGDHIRQQLAYVEKAKKLWAEQLADGTAQEVPF